MRAGGAPAPAVPPSGAQAARPVILVAGNPNSGKSTLFNALTGAHVKVSNYPGVTVTRTTAVVQIPGFGPADLVDLPGTYSLSARSRDEQRARHPPPARICASRRTRDRRHRRGPFAETA